jgi:uracil phosphoribosyltransferase-like protein
VAHIGLYREPETFAAVEYFFKAPMDLSERLVIVVVPILATANTAVAAVDRPTFVRAPKKSRARSTRSLNGMSRLCLIRSGPAKPLGVRGAVMADTVGAGLP